MIIKITTIKELIKKGIHFDMGCSQKEIEKIINKRKIKYTGKGFYSFNDSAIYVRKIIPTYSRIKII